ncbi:glycosyltransferase family 2 protein [Paenibacillus contaminans]|uniref:Glycosyltransferase family 2 protein n=1 Tax=Paenibacillus contaminans TaxID=450362 RepID=A0A329MQ69_9BACL|nr:glycosyltransferase family 2 protein [Paenibacillus contaminans]RAV22069.1 glycosyltransferase family 2 protein [Paenibacillus contaminans]
MLTSIVIITFNNLHKTINCIQSIRTFTSLPYEIIIVDNGSLDDTVPYLERLGGLTIIANKRNRGFAAGCNQGMKVAKGELLLLLNNDTIVSHRWLDNLRLTLESEPNVGIVGPKSNWVIPVQTVKPVYASEAEYHQFADAFNRHDPLKWREVTCLSGFCILFRRSLYKRIGEMDESFIYGVHEDTDYCYRTIRAGYKLLIAGDTFVHHEGNSGFKGGSLDMNAIAAYNRRTFLKKWGVDPDRLAYTCDELFLPENRGPAVKTSRLPGGILVKGAGDTIYYLERGRKRPIVPGDTFFCFGFRRERIITVPDNELSEIPDGLAIDYAGPFPAYFPRTFVAKDSGTGVYVVAHGIVIPIASYEDFIAMKFSADEIVQIPDAYFSGLHYGYGPGLEPDNACQEYELIDYKLYEAPGGGLYYSEGLELREIADERLFDCYKWSPERVMRLTEEQFAACRIGRPIERAAGEK